MKDYKVISSNYDPETGISTVSIGTKEGIFTGECKLLDCDRDIASSFSGCEYAEIKAERKHIKYKRRMVRNNLKCFIDFYNSICHAKAFSTESFEARRIIRKINELQNELVHLNNLIFYDKDTYLRYIQKKAEYARSLRDKKTKVQID